ncbi:2-methylcitrate dehydratase [Saliniradius amylolyticus]|uniref:2-methylcitrate dehydratase n=1 Tax=Saliniradius amylolyticus TaxID=2183582 RepID=A0A2S2E2Y9_9ALTE|nr:bifunctional 2-methylcitrate dehydratase/aconitate hydratase [Saliniradius amylolyticus]AWL11882.1 2-methylcitrate dehydratase [Saliniradius amylolyticus]
MSRDAEQHSYDQVIQDIADYVLDYKIESPEAWQTARYCLMDSLGCAMLALRFPECASHLGPRVRGHQVPGGARVPGTQFQLDPEKAAFDIGSLIRWLDFNDTWLAAEWGHPSDNLGAILAMGDFLSQSDRKMVMRNLFEAMIKAHEIQGILALENSFNRVGLDHVILVKVASTAVVTWLMGGNRDQIMAAVSHAFVDGQALRTYRHAPNTGPRKSWAAGDATARAITLASLALRGEPGVPSALTAAQWGFYDVVFSHANKDLSLKPVSERQFRFQRDYGCYVMENILFKLSFPAEFHGQTACEAALTLHSQVKDRLDDIQHIELTTHESALRIIAKEGKLTNPADRDHCLQYMVAVCLLFGELTADHYADEFHQSHPEIDQLRDKMRLTEDSAYSRDYLEPSKRAIPNAVQVFFKDGSASDRAEVLYPIGHRRRREEGIRVLERKFERNLSTRFPVAQCQRLIELMNDEQGLMNLPVHQFMEHWRI